MSAAKRIRVEDVCRLEMLPPHLLLRVLRGVLDDSRAVGGVVLANKALLAMAVRIRPLWAELWARYALGVGCLPPGVCGRVVCSSSREELVSMKVPRLYWREIEERILSGSRMPRLVTFDVYGHRGVMVGRNEMVVHNTSAEASLVPLEGGMVLGVGGMGGDVSYVGAVDVGSVVLEYRLPMRGAIFVPLHGHDWAPCFIPGYMTTGMTVWLPRVKRLVFVEFKGTSRVVATGSGMETFVWGQLESPDSYAVERAECVGTAWGGRWFLCGYQRRRSGVTEDVLAVAWTEDLGAGRFDPVRWVGHDGRFEAVCEVSGGAGAIVATLGDSGRVSIWSLGAGKGCLYRLSAGFKVCDMCAPTPHMLLLVGEDGLVRVARSDDWRLCGNVGSELDGVKRVVNCWCMQGRVVLCAVREHEARAWLVWN